LESFCPFKSGILIIGICFKLNHKKALMADKMGFIKGSVTRKSELNDKRRYTDCTAVPSNSFHVYLSRGKALAVISVVVHQQLKVHHRPSGRYY
jgi:hypothetical protein